MADPREKPQPRREPEDEGRENTDGQSSRPDAWPGIPGPEEEYLGSLATHPDTKDPPARVTQSQKDLERDEKRDLEQWEDDQREESELR
jgi:hypothetical protein